MPGAGVLTPSDGRTAPRGLRVERLLLHAVKTLRPRLLETRITCAPCTPSLSTLAEGAGVLPR